MVAMPYVGDASRAFWNEHVLSYHSSSTSTALAVYSSLGGGLRAGNFFDNSVQVGKPWSICESREMRTTDHSIKFGLRSALLFREGHHRKCPPHQRALRVSDFKA